MWISREAVAACFALLLMAAGGFATPASAQPPRIGWVYRIEGHLDGQPVQYVGSAADIKQRLSSNHRWTTLLQQQGTRVYTMEVFAELDVQASGKRTLLSARNEALRAAEQRALQQVEKQVEATNRNRAADARETKVLNERRAATDAGAWEARHKVAASNRWQLLERRAAKVTTKAVVALTLLDAYLIYRDDKISQYVMAPYVLGDEQGFFMLEQDSTLMSSNHYKTYLGEETKGRRVEITSSEFRLLQEEAEALWGTTDWQGNFVPGLLNRTLPVIREQGAGQVY